MVYDVMSEKKSFWKIQEAILSLGRVVSIEILDSEDDYHLFGIGKAKLIDDTDGMRKRFDVGHTSFCPLLNWEELKCTYDDSHNTLVLKDSLFKITMSKIDLLEKKIKLIKSLLFNIDESCSHSHVINIITEFNGVRLVQDFFGCTYSESRDYFEIIGADNSIKININDIIGILYDNFDNTQCFHLFFEQGIICINI